MTNDDGAAVPAGSISQRALESMDEGKSVLVLIESPDGSAGSTGAEIERNRPVVSRVVCAATCALNAGGLVDEIDIEDAASAAIIVEDAQWADATSLGRLQRLLTSESTPHLVVVAHRPVEGLEAWGIQRLSDAAANRATVLDVTVEGSSTGQGHTELDGQALDLIAASSLITGPISVGVASQVLGVSEETVIQIGTELIDSGLLRQTRAGFMSTAQTSQAVQDHDARVGNVAAKLAGVLEVSGSPAPVVGALRTEAGQYDMAFPLLASAAQDAAERNANGEAFRLSQKAIDAAGRAEFPPDSGLLAPLHLFSARFLRSAGRTSWAREEIEKAIANGAPDQRAQAFHLAAAIADDGQRPQEGEALVAIAEWEARQGGQASVLASLLAFRARELHRIGFALEADDALAKAEALAAKSDSESARYRSMLNKAWIHFDRGELARAEIEFARLRETAEKHEGLDSVADKEAWRARSLLPSGHPQEALEAIRVANDLAATEGVEAPVFLTDLAMADGLFSYGQVQASLAAAERALDLVTRQLPAWENTVLASRARVHLSSGDVESARQDIRRALELTPAGANGWRWRTRCRALELEIEGAGGGQWSEEDAEDVADLLLQSKLYGWAAEALCAIAENGGRQSAAKEAMLLALHCGLPLTAARAAAAGELWDDPDAVGVILAIRAVDQRVPPEWTDDWRQIPHIAAALIAPEPQADPDLDSAAVALSEALSRAGLSSDTTVLSPAQRRSSGLVAGGKRSTGRSRMWMVAAALGVVVIAAGTAFAVTQLGSGDEQAASTVATTIPESPSTTVALALEETELGPPPGEDFFYGISEYRGGPERTGFVDVSAPRSVAGYYWTLRTAGPISASPVTWGRYVYAGSTEGSFYGLDQTDGSEVWTLPPEGQVSTASAFGEADDGEGAPVVTMVVVDDDGIVRGRRADGGGGAAWSTPLGERIRSTPLVIDGVVYVATGGGVVYGLDVVNGEVLWRYPSEEAGTIGPVTAGLTFSNGQLYVGTEDGILHILDVSGESPVETCTFDAGAPIAVNPIVVDDIVYVATRGQSIWPLVRGQCEDKASGRLPVYATETPVDVAPAIVGEIMYIPEDRFLYAKNLATNEDMWRPDTVTATRPISTAPVVTRDAVYFGSEDGFVYAVDSTTGESLWTWNTGLPVRGTPAVVDGAVFIVTGDGSIYAVGE